MLPVSLGWALRDIQKTAAKETKENIATNFKIVLKLSEQFTFFMSNTDRLIKPK